MPRGISLSTRLFPHTQKIENPPANLTQLQKTLASSTKRPTTPTFYLRFTLSKPLRNHLNPTNSPLVRGTTAPKRNRKQKKKKNRKDNIFFSKIRILNLRFVQNQEDSRKKDTESVTRRVWSIGRCPFLRRRTPEYGDRRWRYSGTDGRKSLGLERDVSSL